VTKDESINVDLTFTKNHFELRGHAGCGELVVTGGRGGP
jgi:hypothetical protein